MKENRNPNKMTESELDEALNSSEQRAIRDLVSALADEAPSLAWRSELNAKLRNGRIKRARLRLVGWIGGPAVAFGLAATMLFTFSSPQQPPRAVQTGQPASVEARIVQAHSEADWDSQIGGSSDLGDVAEDVGGPL